MHKMVPILVGGAVLVGGVLLNIFYEPVVVQQSRPEPAAPPPAVANVATQPPPETFAPVFEPCAHCHQVGEGAKNSTGPVLNAILGKPAASGDYPYSQAMQDADLVWDEETLKAFIMAPETVVPDSRMYFGGVPEEEAEAIIEFLKAPSADQSL
ncbi:c-type cytochrome [Pelagibacterium sp. H642]|uniref:c-type cytochrome n=1 Tax=Pelagibacterium sp. H642 TaxID=1881069 RepID=UPI0028150BA5|nr:c-type cytochrome [Pelagibacterium sp. H642]WMT91272.1 c-type cytochrome [Pelagibacterium sp. H642]